jgi:hypothetical protein
MSTENFSSIGWNIPEICSRKNWLFEHCHLQGFRGIFIENRSFDIFQNGLHHTSCNSYFIVSWLSLQFLDRMAYDSSSPHEIACEKTRLVHADFYRLTVHQEGFLSKWWPDSHSPDQITCRSPLSRKPDFHWFLASQWDSEKLSPDSSSPHETNFMQSLFWKVDFHWSLVYQ